MLVLLLIIPVQGMAAMVHAFGCAPDGSAVAAPAHHGSDIHDHTGVADHDHDHGAAHKHGHQSDQGAADHAQHQCCHQVTAAPTVYISPAPADLPVYPSFSPVLELTFVLEQPQRPPRA